MIVAGATVKAFQEGNKDTAMSSVSSVCIQTAFLRSIQSVGAVAI